MAKKLGKHIYLEGELNKRIAVEMKKEKRLFSPMVNVLLQEALDNRQWSQIEKGEDGTARLTESSQNGNRA